MSILRFYVEKSGKSSVELGREFHPKDYSYDGEKQKTSHRWERYAAGTHSPVDDTETSLIDIVEGKYPGTAYWFRHLVWTSMGQGITNTNEINVMLASLDASVVDICRPLIGNASICDSDYFADCNLIYSGKSPIFYDKSLTFRVTLRGGVPYTFFF